MAWIRPELLDLVVRIESDITSRLTGGVSLLRRSFLAILARVWAGVAHTLHGFLLYLSQQLFPDSAESEYLDRLANIWGVPRIAASFASGSVVFTGDPDGTVIPEGTIVLRDDGSEYATDAEATIASASATVAVTCRVTGDTGNSDPSTVFSLQSPIIGVEDAVTVDSEGISGGTDIEADAALRTRLLARIQNPPAGGAEADYLGWARSIPGVSNAWVYPNYYGLGTVAVVITATGDDPVPDGDLVTEVQDYIDEVRPVTADVTVAPIVESEVTFEISISPNTSALREAVTAQLEEMFSDDAVPGGTLLISHIQEAVLTSGIEDFLITDISVEGSPVSIANIPFTGFDYPVLGAITFNTL